MMQLFSMAARCRLRISYHYIHGRNWDYQELSVYRRELSTYHGITVRVCKARVDVHSVDLST